MSDATAGRASTARRVRKHSASVKALGAASASAFAPGDALSPGPSVPPQGRT